MTADLPVISLVVPVYDEEASLPGFWAATRPVLEALGEPYEVVFVDDGSRDGTLGWLVAAQSQHPEIRVVALSRNFGKDVALSAGLAHATGQAVIPIDCDLQHPPAKIPELVGKWREGHDMVLAVRANRDEESWLRRLFARMFYKVLGRMSRVKIPPDAGDFRLMDRKVVDVINQMPERCRFMKGVFAWPGFKTTQIEFEAGVRKGGRSSWGLWRLWRFALDGLFSFSTAPLLIWTYLGLLFAGGAFVYLMITLVQTFVFGIDVPGYASLLSVVLFFNGVLLISNGIQGEYLARIFEEVKARPLYVVRQTWGLSSQLQRPSAISASAASPTKNASSSGTTPGGS